MPMSSICEAWVLSFPLVWPKKCHQSYFKVVTLVIASIGMMLDSAVGGSNHSKITAFSIFSIYIQTIT